MIRKIIQIDEEKCNGCGACAHACHEGAIDIIDGKAKLMREHFCDGLGDCLPNCPADAISFVEREAPSYDEAAVKAAQAMKKVSRVSVPPRAVCPGSRIETTAQAVPEGSDTSSQLSAWPVQLKLVHPAAPCFQESDLLVAADCSAFACGDFHNRFLRDRAVVIGCPKLDAVDYTEKLAQIISLNSIRSVTVVRMEVPCCGGLESAVKRALLASGKVLPLQVVILSSSGRILSE